MIFEGLFEMSATRHSPLGLFVLNNLYYISIIITTITIIADELSNATEVNGTTG